MTDEFFDPTPPKKKEPSPSSPQPMPVYFWALFFGVILCVVLSTLGPRSQQHMQRMFEGPLSPKQQELQLDNLLDASVPADAPEFFVNIGLEFSRPAVDKIATKWQSKGWAVRIQSFPPGQGGGGGHRLSFIRQPRAPGGRIIATAAISTGTFSQLLNLPEQKSLLKRAVAEHPFKGGDWQGEVRYILIPEGVTTQAIREMIPEWSSNGLRVTSSAQFITLERR